MEEDMVKMSPKGQLVVPMEIREKEKFRSGDRFVAVGIKSGVLFKRVNIPDVRIEFESLSKEIAKQFKERKVEEKDVDEAVRWSRQR